jgi:hypothetical protein
MSERRHTAKSLPNEHHCAEIRRINSRRGARGRVRWIGADGATGDALEPHAPGVVFDHAGLAFSGGGIRSAAFCLGALQAIEAEGKLPAIDYLSTVSGGGYVGCSLAAAMGATGAFPFSARSDVDHANEANINDLKDSAAVQHIRDYSNYLMPRGFADLTLSIGVVLRGLVASGALVFGPLLLLAALATFLHPTQGSLKSRDAFGLPIKNCPLGHWALAAIILIGLIAFLFVWGVARSRDEARGKAPYEFKSVWPLVARWISAALLVAAFIEIQPLALLALFEAQGAAGGLAGFLAGNVMAGVSAATKYLAPIAGVIAFFAGRLADMVKANAADASWAGLSRRLVSQFLLVLAAIVVPVSLWLCWLYLVFWGTAVDAAASPLSAAMPGWLGNIGAASAPRVYFVSGAALTAASLFLEPNANSLHRLYRDRLSDAFLFLTRREQDLLAARASSAGPAPRTRSMAGDSLSQDVVALDALKLSAVDTDRVPYLLINAALNIQGSPYVNKRGRNADFFLFSRDYVGSHATGFAPTTTMEAAHPALDLGTAMAISGAAVSSNMGDYSIRILAPTLALLNVRLGYWLPNPAPMEGMIDRDSREPIAPRRAGQWGPPSRFYLFEEMFSLLDETSPQVYLTDGGHIENLGVYELLKRRCRLIVVVDVEADPSYAFSAFVTLQRYARIDLGIRIDALPWSAIRARSRAYDEALAAANASGEAPKATPGCHAAVGRIDYPGAPPGVLLYVKSSLTGDENDLIRAYKSANPSFPHETTGDQFFDETQFEAYRALGFHAVKGVLSGEAWVPGLIASEIDGSPLPGQSEADAQALRKTAIDEMFNGRTRAAPEPSLST